MITLREYNTLVLVYVKGKELPYVKEIMVIDNKEE